ncbi:MAG: monovalent cation/H(+) antiporter subunit G [Gammaproteobacteria bacterium]|nr:MAG: monovalent cation/H(+) antiporter subunit G [Gammaproteobacteria bacterium]
MILDILSWISITTGCLLGIIGGIGLIRFPDFYSRIHAAGITDTLCAALILLGLGLQSGWSFDSVKLFLIYAFLFFTTPTSSYSLGNWAWQSGIKPWKRPTSDLTDADND